LSATSGNIMQINSVNIYASTRGVNVGATGGGWIGMASFSIQQSVNDGFVVASGFVGTLLMINVAINGSSTSGNLGGFYDLKVAATSSSATVSLVNCVLNSTNSNACVNVASGVNFIMMGGSVTNPNGTITGTTAGSSFLFKIIGYNPVAKFAQTAGGSPYSFKAHYDCTIVITSIPGTISSITIGGQTILNGSYAVGNTFHLPANVTMVVTWATTAPVFEVVGE
jgi:hypothetical protein